MSFADTYLSRYASRQMQQLPLPDPKLFLSVVIPVYNEPGLIQCLNSLITADSPDIPWEILIVINEPEICPEAYHKQNQKTKIEVEDFARIQAGSKVSIHILNPGPFPNKKAGPGMARKIGMDESIRRFNSLDRPEGIIVSFDADTVCSPDYLRELAGFYKQFPKSGGCTVYFEHDLNEKYCDKPINHNAIVQYELYLRYFKLALEWMTFPYANYALGSAFSVRASRYVMAGGMGLQQAGEDFYFLQKCIPQGNFYELNTTSVYPSARTSDRVVFGTGPFISRFIEEGRSELEVFPYEIFRICRPLFAWIKALKKFPESLSQIDRIIEDFPLDVRSRMKILNWDNKISQAFEESAGLISFKKRFYHEISLLQIIRLFNELSVHGYPKTPVREEFQKLMLELRGENEGGDIANLLEIARKYEKLKAVSRIS